MDTFNRNFYQSDGGKFSLQLQNAISKKTPHALTTNLVSTSRQRNGKQKNHMSKKKNHEKIGKQ